MVQQIHSHINIHINAERHQGNDAGPLLTTVGQPLHHTVCKLKHRPSDKQIKWSNQKSACSDDRHWSALILLFLHVTPHPCWDLYKVRKTVTSSSWFMALGQKEKAHRVPSPESVSPQVILDGCREGSEPSTPEHSCLQSGWVTHTQKQIQRVFKKCRNKTQV